MPVILFEGLSGVGTTTLAEAVAKHAGGIAVTSEPLGEAWDTYGEEVETGDDVDARFEYHMQRNLIHMMRAQQLSEEGQVATLDQSIYRTLATHWVMGSKAANDFKYPTDLKPDKGFMLYLSEDRLKQRIAESAIQRPISHWEETLRANSGRVAKLLKHSFGLQVLNARRSVDALVQMQAIQSEL